MSVDHHAHAFATLHQAKPGFVMPNAWDAGSAVVLAASGFPAIATTSAGIAFSLGKQDYGVSDARLGVTREEMLKRMGEIAAAVDVPVNGDLEAGFGDTPEAVAETVRAAIEVGLAGGNIEDKKPLVPGLYDKVLAAERIRAAREMIDSLKSSFVLTARSDVLQSDKSNLAEAIERSNLYRAAGADCLFTPGISDLPSIRRLAGEIEGPLNMVMGLGTADGNTRAWLEAGVQRISLGGSMARAALGFLQRAARELREEGTITFAEIQIPQPELNALFGRRS